MNPPAQSDTVRFFQGRILSWFKKNGRNYPWRVEIDPFRILIAEIMLQRTRADQVMPVYTEFMAHFSDSNAVVHASIDDVGKFIKKLGLTRRARLIKEMAQCIVTRYKNLIPQDRSLLLDIPRVGDYIADAMIVFAFGGRRTIIDSNVVRLVSRFFGIQGRGEMRRNRNFVDFCQTLSRSLRQHKVKAFNWGLLDISSLICKPAPKCDVCPLSDKCSYFNRAYHNKTF